ncbi:MAG: CPBP family intramembrane metalloprotease [Chitinophagaceae bacterium]
MKSIRSYLSDYFRFVNRTVFIVTLAFTAILVTINYTVGIEKRINTFSSPLLRFASFSALYIFTFCAVHIGQLLIARKSIPKQKNFLLLLLLCPAVFAAKITFDWFTHLTTDHLSYPWKQYWYQVLNWPFKCVLVMALVWLIWKWQRFEKPVAGLLLKGFDARPYFFLLLLMIPLIAFAATRQDFLHTYPKFQRVAFIDSYVTHPMPWKLLYELCYGIDFITIELFFRGFLILVFARFVGKDAILPMAAFYCTIHFGKPLFECITSFFGGLILGAVVYNTRSIWGGVIVHLGIAWLMEAGGYVGQLVLGYK